MVAYQSINQTYYDDIDDKMATLEQPRVYDALKVMQKKGNVPYFTAYFKKFSRHALEEEFTLGTIWHEITHLFTRLGHAPQQEMDVFNTLYALQYKTDSEHDFQKAYKHSRNHFKNIATDYMSSTAAKTLRNPSARSTSIHFAAGLYLRQKISKYVADHMENADYATQKNFADSYGNPANDSKTELLNFTDAEQRIVNQAPYELIKISREEWRTIEAVAVGLAKPEETKYPERMKALKDILVETGLFYDLKSKHNIAGKADNQLSRG